MGKPRLAHHPRVDSVNNRRGSVPCRIIKGERLLQGVAAFREPPKQAQSSPDHSVPGHSCSVVAVLLAQAQEFPCNPVRFGHLTTVIVEHRLAEQDWKQLWGGAKFVAQLASSGVGASGLWCRKAFPGN